MSVIDAEYLDTDERAGDWGCTSSGRRYHPEDPRPGDFHIDDIAHALANQCRYGGHVRAFYSVAEHSVRVSYECCARFALNGLLHDASEAYLVDVPRPLKHSRGMEGYRLAEELMQTAIWWQFVGLPARRFNTGDPYVLPACVKRADEQLLATEARDLMPQDGPGGVRNWRLSHEPLPHLDLRRPWSPRTAKRRFLRRYRELTWRLTPWDRVVIRVREALGLRGCA